MISLICEIRKLVRDAKVRSKSGRCKYTEEQKIKILLFADEIKREGLTTHDAASILGMNRATLESWLR